MAGVAINQSHPQRVSDIIDLEGFTRTDLAVATAATQSAVIDEGFYDVWADQNMYIEISPSATALTSSNGYLLRQNNTITVLIRKNSKIAGMMVTASGTLSWHKVG